ncbi:MAG: hypothetical protein K0R68_2864 [Mycobacterium sp.]|nr:hypothetical protein [Mycobacterium sp.]
MEVALVLLGVAAVASISGYVGSAVQRRRRTGRVFALGFLCGAWVSTALREHHRRRPVALVSRVLRHKRPRWSLTP